MQQEVYAGGVIVPRYYFDITDAGHLARDEHGSECADDRDARDQAISLLPDIARDELPDGDQHKFVATVRNESGQIVYEASLALNGRWWPGRR